MLLITFVGSRVLASKFDEMRTVGAGIVSANRIGSRAAGWSAGASGEPNLLEINMQADCDCERDRDCYKDVAAYEKFIQKYQYH